MEGRPLNIEPILFKDAGKRNCCTKRLMIENSPRALYLVDDQTGSVLYFNHSFSQFWSLLDLEEKMERSELKESDMLSHIYPLLQDVQAFAELHGPHQDGSNPSAAEGEMTLQDGRIIHWFSAKIRDDHGCCFGRLNIFEDITERRLAENNLKASEEIFRSIFEESPIGIQLYDSNGRLVKANQACLDILGMSPEEIMGLSLFEDLDLDLNLIDKLGRGDAVGYKKTLKIEKASPESLRYVNCQITPLRTAMSSCYLVQVQDITDRRKMETMLEGTINLGEWNKWQKEFDGQKAEFISLASHEMRTPLSVINSYLELFADGALGELTESQHKKIQIIQAQSDRLIDLVDTLLDVYDMDVKNLKMQAEPVDLADVAQSAIDGLSRLACLKEHDLSLTAESGLPFIAGDDKRLFQVFHNILTNAIKYTPDNGRIEIRIRRDGDSVLTAISDNGKGISEKNLERIFDPFFIGEEGSLAREDRRLGLGLALVKRIIEAHQGRIWIKSELGRGSTFYFTLPCSEVALQCSRYEDSE